MQDRSKKIAMYNQNKELAIAKELFDIADKVDVIDSIISKIDVEKLEYLQGEAALPPSREELISIILPLIPPPIPGKRRGQHIQEHHQRMMGVERQGLSLIHQEMRTLLQCLYLLLLL